MSTRYSPKAQETVHKTMKKFKKGQLKSSTGDKVTNPKQAVAIGLSEARKKGQKAPRKSS